MCSPQICTVNADRGYGKDSCQTISKGQSFHMFRSHNNKKSYNGEHGTIFGYSPTASTSSTTHALSEICFSDLKLPLIRKPLLQQHNASEISPMEPLLHPSCFPLQRSTANANDNDVSLVSIIWRLHGYHAGLPMPTELTPGSPVLERRPL